MDNFKTHGAKLLVPSLGISIPANQLRSLMDKARNVLDMDSVNSLPLSQAQQDNLVGVVADYFIGERRLEEVPDTKRAKQQLGSLSKKARDFSNILRLFRDDAGLQMLAMQGDDNLDTSWSRREFKHEVLEDVASYADGIAAWADGQSKRITAGKKTGTPKTLRNYLKQRVENIIWEILGEDFQPHSQQTVEIISDIFRLIGDNIELDSVQKDTARKRR